MSAYTLEHASSLYPWGTGHTGGSTGTPGGRGGVGNMCCINIIEHFQNSLLPKTYRENGGKFVTWCWSARALHENSGGAMEAYKIMTVQCTQWLINVQLCLHYHVQPDWCHVEQTLRIPLLWGATNPQVSSVSLKINFFDSPRGIEQFLHKPSTSGASEEREGTLQHMCLFVWSAHCWVFY